LPGIDGVFSPLLAEKLRHRALTFMGRSSAWILLISLRIAAFLCRQPIHRWK
jgi:uncharacterized membrane protein